MNCLRSVSTGLVSIRYFCGLDRPEVSGKPCTRVMLVAWLPWALSAEPAASPLGVARSPGVGWRCAAPMLAPPRVQLCGAVIVGAALPSPLRWNRPFWPVGRLKPGKVIGLTCCCARFGGSCELTVIRVEKLLPEDWVSVRGPAPT